MRKEWTTPTGEYYQLHKDMLQQPHVLNIAASAAAAWWLWVFVSWYQIGILRMDSIPVYNLFSML